MLRRRPQRSQLELDLLWQAAKQEYETLQTLAADWAETRDILGEYLVADYVDAVPSTLVRYPHAAEYAFKMRKDICRRWSVMSHLTKYSGGLLLLGATGLGWDKQFAFALGVGALAYFIGTYIPDGIEKSHLKAAENRRERWEKLRAASLPCPTKNVVMPVRESNADGSCTTSHSA